MEFIATEKSHVLSVVGLIDGLALVAFLVALVYAIRLAVRNRRDAFGLNQARVLFAMAMGLYALVSLSNMLEHMGITAALDPFEDYLEILFVPLLVYVVFANSSAFENRRLQNAYGMLEGEHELLERILETSGTGIVVAALDGRISFANERAKEILSLGDDEGHSGMPTPGWRLRDLRSPDDDLPPPGRFLLAHTVTDPEREIHCLLEWPDGRTTVLDVNASRMDSQGGTHSATVFSFQDTSHRMGNGSGP